MNSKSLTEKSVGTNQPQHLLSLDNQIAFVEFGKIIFQKTKLINLINRSGMQIESKNHSLAVVTVLGSNKNNARFLHTEWIISYHENFSKAQQVDHLDEKTNNIKNGLYIWPKILKMKQKLSVETNSLLCLLIYVHDEPLLDKYAACISSKTILFKGSEKEKFEKVFQNEQLKPFLKNTYYIVASTGVMLASKQKRLRDVETFFLEKIYGQRDITPKRNTMGQTMKLENLADHLEYVACILNTMSEHQLKKESLLLAVTEQATELEEIPTNIKSQNTEYVNISPKEEKGVHSDLQAQLSNWIENELTIYNVSRLSSSLHVYDKANKAIITAIQHKLVSFNNDLGSIFDKFVCFDNDEITVKLKHLSEKYCCENNHVELPESFLDEKDFKKAQLKLITEYLNDNNKILESEIYIGGQVMDQLLKEYKKGLSNSIGNTKTKYEMSELEATHKIALEYVIGIMERCFEYKGKSNFVVKKLSLQMKTSMQDIFEEFTENLSNIPEQTMTPEKDDIKAYIRHLSEMENNLEKYSTKNLIEFHTEWETKLCEKVSSAEAKMDFQLKLASRLDYLIEKQNELLENSQVPQHGQLNTLCFDIKEDYIQVTSFLDKNLKPIWHSTENGTKSNKFPAKLAFRTNTQQIYFPNQLDQFTRQELDKNFTHGNISSFISNQHYNEKIIIGVLAYFISSIKNKACQQNPGNKFPQTIFIVSNQFDRTCKHLLREAAKKAEFKNVFIFNESSLLAYHYLNESPHRKNDELFVIINARQTSVFVQIFQKYSSDCIRMVALASEPWEVEIYLENQSQPLVAPLIKILNATFQKAVDQLPSSISNARKRCLIISEKPGWMYLLRYFFHYVDQAVIEIPICGEQENLATNVIEKRIGNPADVRNRILDFVVHIDEGIDFEDDEVTKF